MVFDMLRTPNQNTARLVSESGEVFWVRWYKALPDAKPFPDWHAFGSQYWEWNPEFEGPGMIKEPIIYQRGRFPEAPGQMFHGMKEWYLNGMPRELLDITPLDDSCGVPTEDPRGGVVLGGTADQAHEDVYMSLIVTKRVVATLTTPGVLPVEIDDVAMLLSAGSPIDMTGIDPGVNGRILTLRNIGGELINFLHEDLTAPAAARIICLDQVSARLYPRSEILFEWDEDANRWEEIRSIPYLQQKGDLITHNATEPHVLHTSGNDGHVLTEDSTDALGVKWKPPNNAVGADWWYWPPGATGDSPLNTWILPGAVFGGMGVNENVQADQVLVLPLPRPRGGTLDKIGFYWGGGIDPVDVLIGFYTNVNTTGICWPGALISSQVLSGFSAQKNVFTLDTPVVLTAGQLLWVAFLGSVGSDLGSVSSVAVPGQGLYPVYGFEERATDWKGPLCGIGLGADSSGMGSGTWPYGDGLPDPFPDPDDAAVSLLGIAGFPVLPAMFLHHSG